MLHFYVYVFLRVNFTFTCCLRVTFLRLRVVYVLQFTFTSCIFFDSQ